MRDEPVPSPLPLAWQSRTVLLLVLAPAGVYAALQLVDAPSYSSVLFALGISLLFHRAGSGPARSHGRSRSSWRFARLLPGLDAQLPPLSPVDAGHHPSPHAGRFAHRSQA